MAMLSGPLPVLQGQGSSDNSSLLPADSLPADKLPLRIFMIGNSLTWDTLPGLLDGQVQWHIDCGKNLQAMFDNPMNPCVKTSVPWPEVLPPGRQHSQQYDILVVQPYLGTTLDDDARLIAHWLELQPSAELVIHTGWSRADDFESSYHAQVEGMPLPMAHSSAYFKALQQRVQEQFPDRRLSTTAAMDVLDTIWHDIQQGQTPLIAFRDLYRDEHHMTTQLGRYLMHNVMRMALHQPPSDQGFQLEPEHKLYLDQKLQHVARFDL